ncbi:MAG: acyloxyacyl hydrolase [Terracidiphilus sp.]|jgi:hypothetical protein
MWYRGCGFVHVLVFGRRCTSVNFGLALLGGVVALWLALPTPASAQDTLPSNGILAAPLVTATDHPAKLPGASEITVEGLVSYGNYKIFASGENCKLYLVGIEYDRHTWGHLLGSRVDYVAEFMPMVLLNQPTEMDIWGNTESASRKTVPGIDIAPIGIRWLWRDGKAFKPYLMAKGGALVFAQKPLSSKTTYENLSLQSALGLEVRLNDRFDLRLGLFGDFHFSDGFIVPVNPGLDVMNATMGLTYHLRGKRQIAGN